MKVTAKIKHLRISPKKVRLVVDVIRGLMVEEAEAQLDFINKKAARPLKKLLASAVANANNNFQLERGNLYIKKIFVNEGPVLKRWQPRAFGRATPIRKRSSAITLVLEEKMESKKSKIIPSEATKEKIKVVKSLKDLPKSVEVQKEKELEREILIAEAEEHRDEPFDSRRKGKHRLKEHLDKKIMKKGRGFLKKIFSRKAV